MADAYWRYGDARHQAAAAAMAPPPATLKRPRAEYQCAYLPSPTADPFRLLRAFLFPYLFLRSGFVSCFPFLPIGFGRFPMWQFASYLRGSIEINPAGYVPSGSDVFAYYPREDEGAAHPTVRDTESLGASYDRYLRNGISSYGAGESVRPVGGGISNQPIDDRRIISIGSLDGRNAGYGGRRPEPQLPPDASNTLFVEGLPADCTRREVSRILLTVFVSFCA
ncbi:hypothetical protein BHE74_00003000 [Ensete ventricosum]|nr:hypothetical protein BHE74_00003000 [Ensete ventricosum]RZR99393.1 hypothetical protein BHM03_00028916 [Ensete ventricosum]